MMIKDGTVFHEDTIDDGHGLQYMEAKRLRADLPRLLDSAGMPEDVRLVLEWI